jgi:hypothetical protein
LWPRCSLCAFIPSRMGGACIWICIERGLGSTVVVAPVAVEAWTPSWWNDRGHVESYHGSYAPIYCARSCSSHHWEWESWWGPTWLPIAPETLVCPSGEAKGCDDVMRARARRRLLPRGRLCPRPHSKARTRQRSYPRGPPCPRPFRWDRARRKLPLSLGK